MSKPQENATNAGADVPRTTTTTDIDYYPASVLMAPWMFIASGAVTMNGGLETGVEAGDVYYRHPGFEIANAVAYGGTAVCLERFVAAFMGPCQHAPDGEWPWYVGVFREKIHVTICRAPPDRKQAMSLLLTVGMQLFATENPAHFAPPIDPFEPAATYGLRQGAALVETDVEERVRRAYAEWDAAR